MTAYNQSAAKALEMAGCYDEEGRLKFVCRKMRELLWRLEPGRSTIGISEDQIEAAFQEADCLEIIHQHPWVRPRCLRLAGIVRRRQRGESE